MIKQTIEHNASVKPTDGVMKKLYADFPQCFSNDGKFDIEKFQNIIQSDVEISREGYDLNFLGKNYANLIACTETETVIQPDLEHNALPENANSQNVYISGDNLDALKHLLKSYSGHVKCIYIDPPYNTGSDGFVYNDKFNFTIDQLQTKLGLTEEKAKRIFDLCTRGSASHSAWLMFMAPRLILARELLTEDGVIFISIDDNEQANLKLLCDNVFGEENLVSQLIWESKYTVSNDSQYVSGQHEYIPFYARNKDSFVIGRLERTEKQNSSYTNKDNDPKGAWKATPLHAKSGTEKSKYDVVFPNGIKWSCPQGRYPRYSKETLLRYYENGELYFNKNGGVDKKTYLSEVEKKGVVPGSVLSYDIVGHTHGNNEELAELLGKGIFDNPKGIKLISHLSKLANLNPESDIVLDFFSGSATTAHAIMKLNSEGRCNKFIMVQIPEKTPIESEAYKAGYITIDQIGQERIRRAAKKIKNDLRSEISQLENQMNAKEEKLENESIYKNGNNKDYPLIKEIEELKTNIENKRKTLEDTDFGFKHYTLLDVAQTTLDKMESFDPNGIFGDEDILRKFGEQTVLETWLVKDGYGFTIDAEKLQLANYMAYHCGSHIYFITGEKFDENAVIALIDKYNSDPSFNPQNIVLFGYSFTFTQTEVLRKNLNTLNDSAKNLNINIDIRY